MQLCDGNIQQISSSCSVMTSKEYTKRHDLVVNIIYEELLKNITSGNKTIKPPYLYKPPLFKKREMSKYAEISLSLLTKTNVLHNRPDILLITKPEKLQAL